jgi:signal peptidase II
VRGLLAGIAGAIVAADQLTKLWALAWLDPARSIPVVPGFFDLTLVLNPGVAFGMLGGVPAGWRWIVTVVSGAALLLLVSLARRLVPAGGRLPSIALGLVFGGALGNLIDRWRLGAVVDFIDVHWRGYHWPAFNVADSAITVGVVLLASELLLRGREGPTDVRA